MKAFYRVEIAEFEAGGVVDANGFYHGVRFKDGVAFLNWRIFGEHKTEVSAQEFGHDPRFSVTEILESDLPKKPPKKARNAK